jgi:mannose-1-phosphate guanylyltransferase/mannose-6-phosphate isomerase
MRITPVVLCGGEGTRLWPLSRPDRPKPLLPLGTGSSLLADTLERFAVYDPPLVVCARSHAAAVAEAHPRVQLLVEDTPIGTAAAVWRAAAAVSPHTVVLVTPADHLVADPAPLHDAVARAFLHAATDLVLFGLTADRADPELGWIHAVLPVADGVFEVTRFEEKPSTSRAAELLREGASWNSGLFLFRADVVLERSRALGVDGTTPGSFDRRVVEHTRCLVVPVALDWSDLGTWDAVRRRNGVGGRYVLAPGERVPGDVFRVVEGSVEGGRAGDTGAIVVTSGAE